MNYALLLTGTRLFMAPIIWCVTAQGFWIIACILCFLAGLTDFFDGFLARRYHGESVLGSYLDPCADKCFLIGLLYGMHQILPETVPGWLLGLSVFRELLLMGAGCYRWYQRPRVPVRPLWSAKITTTLQFALGVLVLGAHAIGVVLPWALVPVIFGVITVTLVMATIGYMKVGLYE